MKKTIALVGRPNVGKSLLFNRLVKKNLSLVHDRPGVTRDRLAADCRWQGHSFTLIDTGGIGLEDASGFSEAIQQEASLAITMADLIFWVVDGRSGLTPLDQEIAEILRKENKPVFLVVNKMDDPKQDFYENDFLQLGFSTVIAISAAHGRGTQQLIEKTISLLQQKGESAEEKKSAMTSPPAIKLAFVGRPNVGKSSLINATLNDARTLVSEIPGTTRDAIEVPYFRKNQPKQPYLLIDTAGMRQKRHLSDELERQMTARTAHTIQRTDIALLVIDADRGVTEQDKKIAGLIQNAKKPCLIIVNKWDLTRGIKWEDPALISQGRAPKKTLTFQEAFQQAIHQQLFFLYDAPIIFVSALEKKGLTQLFHGIDDLIKRLQTPIPTGPLNRTLQKLIQRHPPPLRQGKRFKILYATAVTSSEAMKPPAFLGFCNDPRLLLPSWLTFVETHLRKTFHLEGLPLIWQWKSRK